MRTIISVIVLLLLAIWPQISSAETMAEFCKKMQETSPNQGDEYIVMQKRMAAMVQKGLDPCKETKVTGSSPRFNLSPILNGNVINSEFQKWSTNDKAITTVTPWTAYSKGDASAVVPSKPQFGRTDRKLVWTSSGGGGTTGGGSGPGSCTRTSNVTTNPTKDGTTITIEIIRNNDCSTTTITTTTTKDGEITVVTTTTNADGTTYTETEKRCKDPAQNPVSEMCGTCESKDAAGVVRTSYCCINIKVDKCQSTDTHSTGEGTTCVCDYIKGTACVSGRGNIVNDVSKLANGEIAASVCSAVNSSECTVIKKSPSNPPKQSKPTTPTATADVPGSLSQAGFIDYAESLMRGGMDASAVFPSGDKVYSRAEIGAATFLSAENATCDGGCNDAPSCAYSPVKCHMAGTAGKTPKLGASVRSLPDGYPGVRDYGYSEDFVLDYLFYYTNLFNSSFTSAHYNTASDSLIGIMAGVSTTPARRWNFGSISDPNGIGVVALNDIVAETEIKANKCPKPGGSIGDFDTRIDPKIPTLAVIVSDAYPRGIVGIVTRNNGTSVDVIANNWLRVDQCSVPEKSAFGANNCYQHAWFNKPMLVTNIPLKSGSAPGISYLINLNK